MANASSAGTLARRLRAALPGDVAIGFVLVLLVLAALVQMAPRLDARLLDAQFAFNRRYFPQPVRHDVVVVGINEAFLDSIEEPLTLSHRYLAEFLRAAASAEPAAIGLDLVLPEKRFDKLAPTEGPQRDFHKTLLTGLMEATARTRVVVAKVWDYDRGHYRDIQIDYASVLSAQEPSVAATASALFCSDFDLRLRHYPGPASDCQPDRTAFTLSSELSAAVGVRRPWTGLVNYQIGDQFNYLPLQDVLALARSGNAARLRELFAGKAVLLGTVQDDTDLVQLPVALAAWLPGRTRVPGVLAHAQSVRSMLNQGLIAPLGAPLLWTLYGGAALFWFGRMRWRKALLLLALSAALLVASNLLLRAGSWLAPAGALLCGWGALIARAGWQSWCNYTEKQRLSLTFSGYVSPQVMQEILSGGVDARRSGSKLPICVLFSDIRNFTGMSEHMPAEQVVALLNRYFGRMTAVVHKHGGTVDKFIGDGLMAFFGAPKALACAEKAALEAAREMLAELEQLNGEGDLALAAPLRIGIGVHSGLAVVGYVGSADRHEYTAIGDTVNVAARLEGLCARLDYPIICSDHVAEQLGRPPMLVELGEQALKGRAPLRVHGWRPPLGVLPAAPRPATAPGA